ncbi:MAG: radical SAM protein [Armatimonadetes bacterium]|nr:radical SAM protein [Armatimonadota bacterium]
MTDRFGREITRLRVSVTDTCNLNCVYCTPFNSSDGRRYDVPDHSSDISNYYWPPNREALSYEKIAEVVRAAVSMGVRKVRLTGGEPLVRPNLHVLVQMIAEIDGIEDLSLSTNGTQLADYAESLAKAGLCRVNVSLDSIDPDRYRAITRGGDISRVIAGIEAAKRAGLSPIKLNCVVEHSSDEPDAIGVARFAEENNLEVRFIPRMDFHLGRFGVVEGGTGGDCKLCDKLRLTSDGQVRPCLFSDLSFNIRELGVVKALEQAILSKPERGSACSQNWIRITGG